MEDSKTPHRENMGDEIVTYAHGYKFIDTFGDEDFGDILIKLIVREIRSDI